MYVYYTNTHTHTLPPYTHTHTRAHTQARTHACIRTHACTRACTHTRTRTRTRTHTHTHTVGVCMFGNLQKSNMLVLYMSYRSSISRSLTKSQWASFSTERGTCRHLYTYTKLSTYIQAHYMYIHYLCQRNASNVVHAAIHSPSTVPHGYWRARTLCPPTTISSVLPTTANGTWS